MRSTADRADTTLVRARSTPAKRWLFDLRSQKRVFDGQSALWECAERKGLRIAQPAAAADRIVDPHQQVPQLVQLARILRLVTVGDVTSLDLEVADPLAVHPVVPPVIARGAEVKAGRAGGGDRQWAFGSVGVDQGDRSVGEPPVGVLA